jgi:hypothetical protein
MAMAAALVTCSCTGPLWQGDWLDGAGAEEWSDAVSAKTPDVREIAAEIDRLEKHIEKYGSVVPKHADVWGEARLMMYRQEFERVMRPDAYKFDASIQATVSTSDQAYLANAFSLQAAVSGGKTASVIDVSKLVSSDVIARDKLVQPSTIANYVTPTGKLALEPTLLEDQKKRYLDHLHQLRRINEGDDNADSPGYALNLMRIPVSVLTGLCTQNGYGAECAITATPHLPDDLLPETFKNLVVNDLVGVLTLPITRVIETVKDEELQRLLDGYEEARRKKRAAEEELNTATRASNQSRMQAAQRNLYETRQQLYDKLAEKIGVNNPVSPRRVNQTPIPTSQIITTFGAHNIAYLAQHVRKAIQNHLACKNAPYHLDVQASLRAELGGAYELLSSPHAQHLWRHCNPILADSIRLQNWKIVADIQEQFIHVDLANLGEAAFKDSKDPILPIVRSMTSILAWTIVIDSALLNTRFVEDMKSAHAAKGCPCSADGWPLFFLPHPPPETCQLFNEYVRCRWPLYVFAIDPETEDQNVGDAFALRREQQLAISLAFASGQIGAGSFTRYVRRIEQDIDTIAINRTIVGFSHGDNTFGWRFYPRVQTPPIDGNLEAIVRDLLIGGRRPGYNLRRRRLEDGVRECVALLIMPSFVPYVDLEITGNWFRLADPKCKALNLKQTMCLSRSVKEIQDQAPHSYDQDHYRPGDVSLMTARLEQLSQRLPLQHQLVSVPFENTHGGFELLSTGVTDLAPELHGWYGAPGINPDGDTALFLVGDNFSVHQTRVIVGGRLIDPFCPIDCSSVSEAKSADCKCQTTPPTSKAATATGGTASKGMAARGGVTLGTPVAVAGPSPDQQAVSSDDVVQASWLKQVRSQLCPPAPAPSINVINSLPSATGLTPSRLLAVDAMNTATMAKDAAADAKNAAAKAKETAAESKMAAADGNTGESQQKADQASKTADDAAKKADDAAKKADTAQNKAAASLAGMTATSTTVANPYEVPHFQVELLSRQVMRVVIPKGVYSLNGFVDVHVATPYGVSAHLAIPVLCDTKAPGAPAYGYKVDEKTKSVKVTYKFESVGDKAKGIYIPVLAATGLDANAVLRIAWDEATGSALKKVQATFEFKVGPKTVTIPEGATPFELLASDGFFEIKADQLKGMVEALLKQLEGQGYSPAKLLPASVESATIKLKPVPPLTDGKTPTHAVKEVPLLNQSVRFEFALEQAPPVMLPPPKPLPAPLPGKPTK